MSDIYGHVEFYHISIGNYMVREVLIKKRPRVWRSVYSTASACVARVLARVQFFINTSKTNLIFYMNIVLLNILMLNLNVLIREQNAVQDMFCKFLQ